MADYVEIIRQTELDKLESVPAKLLAILQGIDNINRNPVNFKGLNESLTALKAYEAQATKTYAAISKAQIEKAKLDLLEAKAATEKSKADLNAAKTADILRKAIEDETKAQQKSTSETDKNTQATNKNTNSVKARNSELAKRKIEDVPFVITNETQAINQNTSATNAEREAGRKLRAEIDAQVRARRDAEAATRAQAKAQADQAAYYQRVNPTLNPKQQYKIVDPNTTTTTPRIDPVPPAVTNNINNATKSLNSFWGLIRRVAYIVPGLGIAGIFTAAFAAASALFDMIMSKGVGARQSLEAFNKAVEDGTSKLGEEVSQIQLVQSHLQLNLKTRSEVSSEISALSAKFPEYLNGLDQEGVSLDDINKALSSQIDLLRFRALQIAAQKESIDSEANYEKAIDKVTIALTQKAKWWEKAIGFVTNESGQTVAYIRAMADAKDALDRMNASKSREIDIIQNEIGALTTASLKRRIEIDEIINQKTGSDRLNQSQLDAIETRKKQIKTIDDLIGYYKRLRQAADDANLGEDSQVNNDVKYWQARVNMAKKGSKELVTVTENLASATRDKELKDLKDKYIFEKKIKEEDLVNNQTYQTEVFLINSRAFKAQNDAQALYERKNRPKKETDRVNEIVAAQQRLTDAQRDAEVQRLNQTIYTNNSIYENEKLTIDQRSAAYAEMFSARLEILALNKDKEMQDIENWQKQYQNEIDKANKTEISKQTEHQKALLIDYEAYQVKKRAITNEYLAEIAKATDDVNGLISKGYEDAGKDVKTLVDAQIKQAGEAVARFQKAQQQQGASEARLRIEKLKKDKEAAEIGVEYAQVAVNAIGDIYDAFSQKRIQQLQDQQDLIDKNLQKEIDGINKTGLSEEEKQRKISDAEDQAAIKKQALAEEERKQKIKQAQTDKAIAIMNIILNTAAAVIHQLGSGDPYTAVARAAFVGATGAAQLAVAVATPIPQYMYGTDNHPGGEMIVGDGNEREWIQSPNGGGKWSPDTATLMSAPKGTKVIPEHILMESILNGQSSLNGGSQMSINNDFKEVVRTNKQIISAIKNQPVPFINMSASGIQAGMVKGNARTRYINNNIQFGG